MPEQLIPLLAVLPQWLQSTGSGAGAAAALPAASGRAASAPVAGSGGRPPEWVVIAGPLGTVRIDHGNTVHASRST